MIRSLHVSSTDSFEGAARAAYRIHQLFRSSAVVQSKMIVRRRRSDDDSVLQFTASPDGYLKTKYKSWRSRFEKKHWEGFSTTQEGLLSRADQAAGMLRAINNLEHDVLHLHWLGWDTLTVEEVGSIEKPVVWTMHDMWPLCGGEHYAPDRPDARFKVGYQKDNRPTGESGPDLNRWVWSRKKASWRRPMTVVCPSRWLSDCVKQSVLFHDCCVHVVPNPIELDIWKPFSRFHARELLGLPQDKRIILFGAIGGGASHRKGGSLLLEALQVLAGKGMKDAHLVVFGQDAPQEEKSLDLPATYLGRLYDDYSMVAAYNAADVMVVPSRQDNLSQTAVEAQACGIPVVAFDVGGLGDIVEHQQTGYLARAFNTEDLAAGINWVLGTAERAEALGQAARLAAEQKYDQQKIVDAYTNIYSQALSSK